MFLELGASRGVAVTLTIGSACQRVNSRISARIHIRRHPIGRQPMSRGGGAGLAAVGFRAAISKPRLQVRFSQLSSSGAEITQSSYRAFKPSEDMWTLRPSLAVMESVLICLGCGSAPTSSTGAARPTATAPSATASPTPPPAAALVACKDMPDQIYVNYDFGFSISCPSDFTWQTYAANQPIPALVFHYRAFDSQYLANYPPGQVQIALYSMDADTLRGWINKHIGPQMSTDPQHYWDTTSNVTDVTMAGHDRPRTR